MRLKRPVRIYQSDRGIWRIEFEREDGSRRWSTLGTRDKAKAKAEFEKFKDWFNHINEQRQ